MQAPAMPYAAFRRVCGYISVVLRCVYLRSFKLLAFSGSQLSARVIQLFNINIRRIGIGQNGLIGKCTAFVASDFVSVACSVSLAPRMSCRCSVHSAIVSGRYCAKIQETIDIVFGNTSFGSELAFFVFILPCNHFLNCLHQP